MIQRITEFSATLVGRWMPDAFVYTIILTFVTLAAGLAYSPAGASDILSSWGDGAFSLLAFTMQMVLFIVAGQAIASSQMAIRFFNRIAREIHTTRQAAVVVTVCSLISNWLNPGFGLVVAAIFATAIARRLPNVNFPLLVASGYSGYVIWHAGLSGAIPLKLASPGDDVLGSVFDQAIPLSQTVFTVENLILCAVLFGTLPILNMLMSDAKGVELGETIADLQDQNEEQHGRETTQSNRPAQKIENSWVLGFAIGAVGLAYAIQHFMNGGGFNLNIMILMLMTTGLLLHGSPRNYVNAISSASPSAAGLILQYPFYGGIMGVMTESGLTSSIANWFVAVSSDTTYLLYTFFSAGLLNIFVPSGGGQWAVQGHIVAESATQLGKPISHAAMAVAYGDAWTNLIQPFWTLPVLAISGLSLRHIMGYCLVTFVWTGAIFGSVLLFVY